MLPGEADSATLIPLMESILDSFESLNRLSGSEEAERSVDILIEQLRAIGLVPVRESCPLWLSDPVMGSLTIPDFPGWQGKAKTRSFSASCPAGIQGELFYDTRSLQAVADNSMAAWASSVRGKIVIADQAFEEYVQRLCQAGALGLVHIWGSAEEALHEETVGPVWGTPVPDDLALYPSIPVISVNYQQGHILLEWLAQQKRPVTAVIRTELNQHVARCSMPVVDIPGESDEFVLLSSHYDSWHEGVTDNATGNALCLAVAAHFHRLQPQLKRGLRIAWWPGHSNARYGGSTWYADRYRQVLQQRCVAHLNVDSPGCKGATEVVVNASGAEGLSFLNRAIRNITGNDARRITPLGKGGDQSFWGCGIPLHFAFREEPALRTSQSPGSGGGWWWHTEADTRDKVESAVLWRDCQIHIGWLHELLVEAALPVDPSHYLTQLLEELENLQSVLDPQFDLVLIKECLLTLRQQIAPLAGSKEEQHQKVVKQAVALWHRARYSSTDDFHYDGSYRGGAWPGLQILRDHKLETTSPQTFLMLTTQYYRQRDRAVSLLQASLDLISQSEEG
ncbi:M28 family peptidase [Erwinia sp. MMLR14_017]|uniref:M28 family peptidase n=1 Tax=Erwinia sp. MMLR14_017 TaxID=3093842 RepID=UPI00298F4DF4|nr:M28 family peptidase [Erwinia sp. MMLR14_017]MDW8844291.1 M28 family peptidase [Erwinia sp. MMLR14_017]